MSKDTLRNFRSRMRARATDSEYFQGQYVGGWSNEVLREVDVVAVKDHSSKRDLIRVEQIIECKGQKTSLG